MKYLAYGLTLETEINFDGILQKSDAPADLVIAEGKVSEKASRPTRIKRRGISAKLGKLENGFILNWEGVGKFKVCGGNKIIFENLGANPGTLKLFLLSEVIGLILYQRGIFLLHSSAVKIGDEAVVFMGIGGAGKSTTAAAFGKAGFTVLNDDMTAIQVIDSKPFVLPAFAQYKVWKSALNGLQIDFSRLEPSFEGADKFLVKQNSETFPREPVPLNRINILFSPKSKFREKRINPILAPVELLKHFSLPVQLLTQNYLQKHFRQSLEIAQFAPIFLMKRPKDFESLENFVNQFK